MFLSWQYLSGGDLLHHIIEEGRFSLDRTKFYSAEIVLALQFLHNKVIRRSDLNNDI